MVKGRQASQTPDRVPMRKQHKNAKVEHQQWPWRTDSSVTEAEWNWWEFLRMRINAAECAGEISRADQGLFLNLMTQMFENGFRNPQHLIAAHLCFFTLKKGEA